MTEKVGIVSLGCARNLVDTEVMAGISRRKNEALIGTVQRVMINGFDPEADMCFGRTQAHAPEVDGVVYLDCGLAAHGQQKVLPGHFADIRITQALDYDLIGQIHG